MILLFTCLRSVRWRINTTKHGNHVLKRIWCSWLQWMNPYCIFMQNIHNTRGGWKVHRLTMTQWSNLTTCDLFFNIVSSADTSSIGVAVLGFPWYRSSHLDPRKSNQLHIWPHHRSDTASQPIIFFMLGNRKKSDGAKSGEYGEWSTSSKSQSCNHRIVCRSIVLVNQDSLLQFSRPL